MHRTTTTTTIAVALALLLEPALAGLASATPSAPVTRAAAGSGPGTSTLEPGQHLNVGDFLLSPNGRFRLSFVDGVMTVSKLPNRLTFETYAQGRGFRESGTRLVLTTDGQLVLYDGDRVVNRVGSGGIEATALSMQDDGNLVLYRNGGVVGSFSTLATGTLRPGGTLLPGELLRAAGTILGMQSDGNLVLRTDGKAVWSTGTQGNPGAAAIQQRDGNFVVYSINGAPLFDTGSVNDLGDLTALVLGPSDLRIITSAGQTIRSRYGSSWDDAAVLQGQQLQPGDRRVAPGAQLILQTDGNLVQYQNGKAVFVRHHIFDAMMRTYGDFEATRLTGAGLVTAFSTGSVGNPGSRLVVQSDGNLVVYTPDNKAVYSRK